jgi:hypothetical protein
MSYRFRHPDMRQEEDAPSWGRVLGALGAVVVISVVLGSWGWHLTEQRARQLRPSGGFPERNLGPRADIADAEEELYGRVGIGQILDARKRRELGSYRWVDRGRHLVRIPIDEAMDEILAEERRR